MFITIVPVGVFQCNCAVIACEETRAAVVIDPGDEPGRIIEIIRGNDLEVASVIHTHAHIDHIMGSNEVVNATAAVARLHQGDWGLWQHVDLVAAHYCIPAPKMPPLGRFLADNEVIQCGRARLRVLHTPGHTPGSCCFALTIDGQNTVLFSGDTLFRGKIGFAFEHPTKRHNLRVILSSIRDRILTLDDDTRVVPGHGPETLVGIERRDNGFLTGI